MSEYISIVPKVIQENEFLEIASDFGDPLEVIREAISNAYDANATQLIINILMDSSQGYQNLIIEFHDNGEGMSYERLINNFWNLGDSYSKDFHDKIGEKGHGTKIYLRADFIDVLTNNGDCVYHSICDGPFKALRKRKLHEPKVCQVENGAIPKGTKIKLEGYSKEYSRYKQDIIKDYIYWFTKHGSIEGEFPENGKKDFKIFLKALDVDDMEELEFGHRFAPENSNINELFGQYETNAAEYFVKKYVWKNEKLEKFPHIKYDVVINVEGDTAKREYNTMLSSRKMNKTGKYKVSDRYGLWLCKDYIPIQRVNDWVTNFGTGSNSVVMLHGFINCQDFNLTANRGTIANTNIDVIENMKAEIETILDFINEDLYKKELFTLKQWQSEAKTMKIEQIEFNRRKSTLGNRKLVNINGIKILEPSSESETFMVFNTLYNFYPSKFEFEPLDYNTSIGIDILARNKTDAKISDCEFWYVELKYVLSANDFNHSFKNLRWIVCWDFGKDIKDGTEIKSNVDSQERVFRIIKTKENKNLYYLENDNSSIRIKILRLKEFIESDLDMKFMYL